MSIGSLKLGNGAKAIVDSTLAAVAPMEKAKVEKAFVDAAKTDGNTFLSADEARIVAGKLSSGPVDAAVKDLQTIFAQRQKANNIDGISAHFTLKESLQTKIISELEDAIKKANGRPMDVNIKIFEFQSDAISNALIKAARENPNVTIRVIADSMQSSNTGGNKLPFILKQKLPNIQVKFKKDFPYTWSNTKKRPVYSHPSSKGLNHHKSLAVVIDGVPDRVLMGSFNWSATADRQYEDLSIFKNQDSSSRRAIEAFNEEFHGYFNDNDACLSPNNFSNFKRAEWKKLREANGDTPGPLRIVRSDDYPLYELPVDTRSIDINGYRPTDTSRLTTLVGSELASQIRRERNANGRFGSMEELLERVPGLSNLSAEKVKKLGEDVLFGSGQVSVNTATLEELDACGFTKTQARAIVAYREKHGDFETVDGLLNVGGISAAQLNRVRKTLNAIDVEVFFNGKRWSETSGNTGYGPGGGRVTPAMTSSGTVEPVRASVTVAATDLFNRAQAGSEILVGMYGMSPGSEEFRSLAAAARRGAKVRVVLDDGTGTKQTVDALKALKDEGLDVSVRVQGKTMHQKFLVVNDDSAKGSANFSTSSSTKHAENRTLVKNHPELADDFRQRFEELWEASRAVF